LRTAWVITEGGENLPSLKTQAVLVEGLMKKYQASSFWSRHERKIVPYIFISPFYITFIVFMVWPVVSAVFMSFTNWMGGGTPKFLGLGNYDEMLYDNRFWLSLWNTAYLSIGCLLVMIPLSLFLAGVLNIGWLKFRGFFRMLYFAPIATSTVAVAVVFIGLYDKEYGVINYLLESLRLPPVPWLDSAAWIKPSILGLVFWRSTGLYMIYFLAGLQTIPHELYEAAWVDGANKPQAFVHITVPMLRPVIVFVAVVATVAALQIFEESFILNRFSMFSAAGPGDSGLTLAFYLYQQGFKFFRLGFGATVGIVIFVLVFSLSLIELKVLGFFARE
jgi:ABC-type sugar transport system permease subunit